MKAAVSKLQLLLALLFVGAAGYVLYTQAAPLLIPPCKEPIEYSVGTVDPRFGISQSQYERALATAAAVWNTEAGRTLVTLGAGADTIPVSLEYSDVQRATELGKNIDAEQSSYDAKKAEVNALRDDFSAAKAQYERSAASYEKRTAAYEKEVAYWNSQGGAPTEEYEKLNREGKALEADRRELNAEADAVNALAKEINNTVQELNALARKINAKVSTYNANAGEDFDQGNYVEDSSGKRITIYEFKNLTDLERVLVHEFGHALGLDHVENPDSIMYSFNIGEGLELSAEDVAELTSACKLDTKAGSGQD